MALRGCHGGEGATALCLEDLVIWQASHPSMHPLISLLMLGQWWFLDTNSSVL